MILVRASLLLLSLRALLPRATGQIVLSCTPDTTTPGCVCTGTEGTRLDLSGAFHYPIQVSDKDTTSGRIYSISLCRSIPCITNATFTAVCLNDRGSYYGCGKPGVATWTVTSFSPMVFSITYPNGDGKRLSVVTVTEDTKATSNSISMSGINGLEYDFSIVLGTASGEVPPGIIGLVLISVSLVGFCCYFAVGAVIKYRVQGARGREMIPQLSFWMNLPFLIKDGVMFSVSPCCNRRNSEYTKI